MTGSGVPARATTKARCRTARIHSGPAIDGGLPSARGRTGDHGGVAARRHQLDAVKMLLLARLESRPVRLDLTFYPYLPAATVATTDPRAYLDLVASSGAMPMAAGVPA